MSEQMYDHQRKKHWPNPTNITVLKDHMMKSIITSSRLTRDWVQQQYSIAIFRMVRRLGVTCPKGCQTTAPSLLLRPQPRLWSTHEPYRAWCSSLLCFNVLIASDSVWRYWEPSHQPYHEPPLFHWVIKASMCISVECLAFGALRKMKESTR